MIADWEGIEEIVAIAETGSFTAAARRLEVSTSHVSRAVATLEGRIGAQVFERTTRSVRLTDVGRSLIVHCRRIIDERNEALDQVRAQSEMRGEVRFTCSAALGERFIAPVIRDYLKDNPKISIEMELTNRIIDIVGEGYDFAIRTGNPSDGRLAARQIAARSLTTCAAPGYLKAHGVPSDPDELAAHTCLVGTNRTWAFRRDGRSVTVNPSGRWRCNSGYAVAEASVAGMGICQLPTFYVAKPLASGRLVRVLEPFESPPEPVWAVYRPRRYLVPKVRGLIDALERCLPGTIP